MNNTNFDNIKIYPTRNNVSIRCGSNAIGIGYDPGPNTGKLIVQSGSGSSY